MTDPVQARVGTTLLGKWKLERLLGEGGMAAVYLGVHTIGRREAIKILHGEVARHAEVRARFEQEAHAVNCLHHPGAVAIHDIDETEDGAPFLVMELLEGESLAQRMAREPRIVEADMLRIVHELLDVLAAAHAIGIVHRDIKPDNLFLLPDGRLKVLDFGIARLRDGAPGRVMTRVGVMLGTPSYMAPEQIKGVDVDHRVDLFAVGAVMFELTAGFEVHGADSEQELLAKMMLEPAPPLARAAAGVSPDLCKVVDRALTFEANERYPDARSMHEDVGALREGKPPPHASAWASGAPVPRPVKPNATRDAAATRAEHVPVSATSAPRPVTLPATLATPPPVVATPAVATAPRTERRTWFLVAGAVVLLLVAALLWLTASSETAPVERDPTESDPTESGRTEGNRTEGNRTDYVAPASGWQDKQDEGDKKRGKGAKKKKKR